MSKSGAGRWRCWARRFLMVLDTSVMNVPISQLVKEFDTEVTARREHRRRPAAGRLADDVSSSLISGASVGPGGFTHGSRPATAWVSAQPAADAAGIALP